MLSRQPQCSEAIHIFDDSRTASRILLALGQSKANVFLQTQFFGNIMREVFGEAKQRLAREIDSYSAPPAEPMAADAWLISSLLQKSIRRGKTAIAQRARADALEA